MKRPTYADLATALNKLVLRCDGPEGVRSDGSNIDTMAERYLLEGIECSCEETSGDRWPELTRVKCDSCKELEERE